MKINTYHDSIQISPADRGAWRIVQNSPGDSSILAELVGWGGENTLTVFASGTQAGDLEFLVVEQTCDNPLVWYRVASLDHTKAQAELAGLLNRLTSDPLDTDTPYCWSDEISELVAKANKRASKRFRATVLRE